MDFSAPAIIARAPQGVSLQPCGPATHGYVARHGATGQIGPSADAHHDPTGLDEALAWYEHQTGQHPRFKIHFTGRWWRGSVLDCLIVPQDPRTGLPDWPAIINHLPKRWPAQICGDSGWTTITDTIHHRHLSMAKASTLSVYAFHLRPSQ
jgi:hypothetical protein